MADFNEGVVEEFRKNGGQVGGPFQGMQLLLMHTIGAKSGQERIIPVAYTTDGDRFVVVASKGGAPTNPQWYSNLLAHPHIQIEVGHETLAAKVSDTEGAEHERLFKQHAAKYPQFNGYQEKTDRVIPVLVLERD